MIKLQKKGKMRSIDEWREREGTGRLQQIKQKKFGWKEKKDENRKIEKEKENKKMK